MIALYIVLGILLFLFLLTLIPVRMDVSFHEQFSLTLRYLFLAFPLAPGGEKGEEEEKEEEPPKEETEGGLGKIKKLLKQEGFSGFLKALFEMVRLAASSSKRLLSHLRIKRFDLYLCLAGAGDAAEAAVRYGELSGAVYSACGFLFGLTRCRRRAVTVDLNYQLEENRVDFSARLSILPLFVLKEGVSLLIKGLPFLRKFLSSGKAKTDREGKVTSNERQ